jgi:D-methionine transport system substrate-binding protein
MGFFLKKPLSELAPGDKIAVPNDPTTRAELSFCFTTTGL